jgi:hypothetical protein
MGASRIEPSVSEVPRIAEQPLVERAALSSSQSIGEGAVMRDQIKSANYALATLLGPHQTFKFFCECEDGSCRERVNVERKDYLSVHESGAGFVVAPHHVHDADSRVVVRGPGYIVLAAA